MRKANDMSRCLTAFDQDSALVAVIEIGLNNWLWQGLFRESTPSVEEAQGQ
jgi:hypothetical protein